MVIEGEFQLGVAIQRAWDFLTDIQRVASCIPSCQKVEVMDGQNFALTISQKLGPISVTFETETRFVELSPPRRVIASGRGKDTLMGSSFEISNQMDLLPITEKDTLVRYKADVKISGRLASLGQSLIKIVAQREVTKAVDFMREKLRGEMDEKL
jgi:uncharacterized protein